MNRGSPMLNQRVAMLAVLAMVAGCGGNNPPPGELAQTIPLEGVTGRIDHFTFDPAGKRLFVSALGNFEQPHGNGGD